MKKTTSDPQVPPRLKTDTEHLSQDGVLRAWREEGILPSTQGDAQNSKNSLSKSTSSGPREIMGFES